MHARYSGSAPSHHQHAKAPDPLAEQHHDPASYANPSRSYQMTNTNEEVNPYVAQGNPYAVTSVEMSDYCSVDLTSPSAGGGENFERQAKEGAGKREGHVKGAVNNPYAAGRMTEGVFAKMVRGSTYSTL